MVNLHLKYEQVFPLAVYGKYVCIFVHLTHCSPNFDDILARLREEARYCELKSDQPREGFGKYKVYLRFERPWGKVLTWLSNVTESLQLRNQTMDIANSSTGNKLNIMKEVGYNFKKTLRKPGEKLTGSKNNRHFCNRCGGEPHCSNQCPALNKKCNTSEKMRHFAKMCRSNTQTKLCKSAQHYSFAKNRVICLIKHLLKLSWKCTIHKNNVFDVWTTWEYSLVKDR